MRYLVDAGIRRNKENKGVVTLRELAIPSRILDPGSGTCKGSDVAVYVSDLWYNVLRGFQHSYHFLYSMCPPMGLMVYLIFRLMLKLVISS